MSLLSDFAGAEFAGSVHWCDDCRQPTTFFQAVGGVPVCGLCGQPPACYEEDTNEADLS